MKITLDSRGYHYRPVVNIFSIVLIMASLMAGMAGCVPAGGPCELVVVSTAGGSVISPGEGLFNYTAGTVVNLVAQAEPDYQFLEWTGDVDTIANVHAAATTITVNNLNNYTSIYALFGWFNVTMIQIDAGYFNTVGLKSDGAVAAVGQDIGNTSGWTGITQVAAGWVHIVGLESDGTVVAVPPSGPPFNTNWGQCNVTDWVNITQIAAGFFHTVGLKRDGTVVAVGLNDAGQCDVGGWTDITQVDAGYFHTVGLRDGGTVVAVGGNLHGECNVTGWIGIVQVSAGGDPTGGYTVGLKADGTVVAVGYNQYGQCNVGG